MSASRVLDFSFPVLVRLEDLFTNSVNFGSFTNFVSFGRNKHSVSSSNFAFFIYEKYIAIMFSIYKQHITTAFSIYEQQIATNFPVFLLSLPLG